MVAPNKKAGVAAGFFVFSIRQFVGAKTSLYSAASSAACSCLAIVPLTADCTFSKARTSIWRTRSRDTPNSAARSEEHTSELQSHVNLVCRLLLEKKKKQKILILCTIIIIHSSLLCNDDRARS